MTRKAAKCSSIKDIITGQNMDKSTAEGGINSMQASAFTITAANIVILLIWDIQHLDANSPCCHIITVK